MTYQVQQKQSNQSVYTDKRKRYDDMEELPDGLPALLLSTVYSGEERSIYLKLYEPQSQKIYFWRDRTGHKPYCFTKANFLDDTIEVITSEKNSKEGMPTYTLQRLVKTDIITDSEINTLKIIAPDPLAISGSSKSIADKIVCWENHVRYYESYLYDNSLVVGAYYIRSSNKLDRYDYQITEAVEIALKNLLWDKIKEATGQAGKEYRYYITSWTKLLNQPIPEIKRLAIDIEVEAEEGKMPSPRDHDRRISAIGMVGSDGFRQVLVLDGLKSNGDSMIQEATICATEREMLSRAFATMLRYPVILTFNGDDFDLPYMYMRAQDPRISPDKIPIKKEDIPIIVKKESFEKKGMQSDPVVVRHGIHIDLYRVFDNRSIQIYAFSKAYTDKRLGDISEALLKDTKFEFEGDISDLPVQTLAQYCIKDAELTCRLTSFNDSLLMKLLIVICRIGKLPLDDISRSGVNQWVRGMFYYEHRQRNELIPSKRELEAKGSASTQAVIKEKKYQGADVIKPDSGVHFNVVVLDFASLYPSIVKVNNLSYETINCMHDECNSNIIEGTTHWVCKKKNGLASLLIGSLRDLRVNYYKHLAKDKNLSATERQLYNVISQACKVILNASYGVLGFESFPLYCLPVADAVTAIGRNTINKTVEKATAENVKVLYGDTDSIFCKNPSKDAIETISQWTKDTMGIDLEVDKEYKYAVFSGLKKNYLGVRPDGTVDIKGLTGKKSHTPPFIKKTFYQVLDTLGKVNNEAEFEAAKSKINDILSEVIRNLKGYKIPVGEMGFSMSVNKALEKYGNGEGMKGLPQHIKAAKILVQSTGRQINAGEKVSYIKSCTSDGVIPLQMARAQDVDVEKYVEIMESIFEQVLTPLDVDFKTILGKPAEQSLQGLFWR